MNLFEVYKLWNIEPVRGLGTKLWDKNGVEYTDLYGGHAVISVGHCHPHYVKMVSEQLGRLGFYSNAVQNSLQRDLAQRLGKVSGYPGHSLFLCNSGAEANENAMKVASFHTGRGRVLAFRKAFHGRTSGAVAATDNPRLRSPFNYSGNVTYIPLNDADAAEKELESKEYAAVIIEGIQGVAGIYEPAEEFLRTLRELCTRTGTLLILDEIQSGYGRTGRFFAHQFASVEADIVTVAKGMANGFPIGGVLISHDFNAVKGMLGTTFGGNYLAMSAAIAVLDIIEKENLVQNALNVGEWLKDNIPASPRIRQVRGRGLMLGIQFNEPVKELRSRLLFEEHIFTGVAGTDMIRLLAPLPLSYEEAGRFVTSLTSIL